MAKVLVVDDSLSVRKVVERTLGSRGFQVCSASSGTEAKAAIERDQPDLIVCDVILPDADGFEVCGFVKAHAQFGKTPVLLMSGIINSKVVEQASRVHADDLMCKPFAADELMRRTETLLSPTPRAVSAVPAAAPSDPAPRIPAAPPREPAPSREPEAAGGNGQPAAGGLDSPLNGFLEQIAALPGVRQVVVVDREGFVIGAVRATTSEGETVGALVSCLKGPFEGMGEDLRCGALQGIIVEYQRGVALLQDTGTTAVLVAVLSDPTALGKVRYYVKRSLPAMFPRH